MKKFKLNPSVSVAFIPGIGKVVEGQEVMGENLDKYSPKLLVEVMPSAAPAAPLLVEPAPSPVPVAAPVAPPAPVQTESAVRPLNEVIGDGAAPSEEGAELTEKRKPGRPKGSTKSGG